MRIEFLGHSSFRITHKGGTVVTDPFDPANVGLPYSKFEADLVLSSHGHPDHNYTAGISGNPFVISSPGEYEVGGVKVRGFSTFHDGQGGKERGKNTVYLFEVEGVSLCHLGDLGHALSEAIVEEMGDLGILFVPVGGVYTIDHIQASKVVSQLEPRYIIPMHYRVEGISDTFKDLQPVSAFLEEMGAEPGEEMDKLEITAGKLPEEPEVVVLKASSK